MRHLYILFCLIFTIKTSIAQITDTQVVSNANSYLNHTWYADSSNIWNNISCGGKTVNTPYWVDVGSHTSLPYCWGGNSTLSEFDNYLLQGKSAGDDNTYVGFGAEPECSVGMDCSGLVTRSYGISTHYSTSALNTYSQFGHHNSYNDLRVGDFVNKPGSHTRLVTQINNNGTITVIEAGSGVGNVGGNGLWKVFEWSYTISELTDDGYNPQYYTDMTNSNNPPEAPTLYSPTNDSSDVPIPVDFDWSSISGAENYRICVATSPDGFDPDAYPDPMFPNPVLDTTTGSTSSYSWSGAQPNTKYYWVVRVYVPGQGTATSSINSFTTETDVSSYPDMVIEDIWTVPANPVAGENVDLYVTIKNVGNAAAEDIHLEYYIDDVYIGDDTHSSLDPNEESDEYVDNYVFSAPGDYNYCVYIDAVANEQDTQNNSYCLSVNVGDPGGGEDIYLTDVSVSPTTVDPGGVITAYATMNYSGNQLDADLPGFNLNYYLSTDCDFSDDDVYLGDDVSDLGSDVLSNDEYETLTIPSDTSIGTYYILFVADANSELDESDENNNIECVQITIDVSSSVTDDDFQTQLVLYPNPTSDIINLESESSFVISKVVIYDLQGKQIRIIEGKHLNRIDISELTSGVYVLKVFSEKNRTAVFRIIKK